MFAHWIAWISAAIFISTLTSYGNLPEDLPVTDGLSVFLDAESVDANGSHVRGMLDRSGNGNDALEVTVGRPEMPVVLEGATPSGLNAVRFDGIGGYAEVAANPDDFDGRAKTTFIVFRADALTSSASAGAGRLMNTAYSIIDSFEPPETQPYIRHRTNEIWLQSGGVFRMNVRNPLGDFISAQTPDESVSAGQFFIGTQEWTDNGELFARIRNAANETFSNDSIGGMAEPEGHLHTRIGAGSDSRTSRLAEFFGGEIAAILVYDRELSSTERENVELYLHAAYLDAQGAGGDPGDPPVLNGLILHLNGMNLITDEEDVMEMVDVSGNENNAIAYVHDPQPAKPTLIASATPSGQDAVRFDGIGGYAEIASNPEDFDGRAKTTITVFRPTHLAGSDYMTNTAYEILDPSVSLEEQSGLRTRTNQIRAFGDQGGNLRVSQRNVTGGFVGVSTENGSISAGEFLIGINQWRENGDLASIVRKADNERFESVGTGADSEPSGHLNTRLGGTSAIGDAEDAVPGEFFEGEIAAFLIYNRELSESELGQVESHLSDVYLGAGPGTGGPGSPPVTDGLVLYLNGANVLTGEGGVVNELVETSGRGNNAVAHVYQTPREGGPTLVPGGAPSGRPTVKFDGSLQYLDIASSPAHFDGRSKTTITVFKADQVNDGRLITSAYEELAPDSSPNGRTRTNEMYVWGSQASLRVNNRSATGGFVAARSPADTLFPGEFYIAMNEWRDNGDTAAVLINAANNRFEEVTSGSDGLPAGHIHTRIGAGSGFGDTNPESYFSGEIAAVLVYDRELSATEMSELEDFLHARYIGGSSGSFADWIAGFDLPVDKRGPADDASGDGIENLLKYAIGLNPTEATPVGLPTLSVEDAGENTFLVLGVQKNPDAGDVTYIVEGSTDLVEWSADPAEVELEEDAESLLARFTVPLEEAPKAFLRLRVLLED